MAKRLTDKDKKQIVADYIECENYSEVARHHNVSVDTVRKVVDKNEEIVRKLKHKKDENTQSVLDHLAEQGGMVNLIIDRYLEALMSEEKIETATVNQLTTALGTLVDKMAFAKERGNGGANATVNLAWLPVKLPDNVPPPYEEEEMEDG